MWRQARLAAEAADDVSPEGVEGDEDDGAVLRRPAAAGGKEKKTSGGRTERSHPG